MQVSLRVHARELQAAAGLTNGQLRQALRIAGSRYDPETGVLTLTCRKYVRREDNRRWVYEALGRLLEEVRGPAGAAATAQEATPATQPVSDRRKAASQKRV